MISRSWLFLFLFLLLPMVSGVVQTHSFLGTAGPGGGNGVYSALLICNETIVLNKVNSTTQGGSASPIWIRVYNASSNGEIGNGSAAGLFTANMTNATGGNLTLYKGQPYFLLSDSTATAGIVFANGRVDNASFSAGGVTCSWAYRYSGVPGSGSWNTANGFAGGLNTLIYENCAANPEMVGCPMVSVVANFSVSAVSSVDGVYVQGLSVLLDGVLWNATGSFVNTSLLLNASAFKNFTLFAPAFFNRSYLNYNLNSSLLSSLDPSFAINFFNVSGVVRSGGVNYSRSLGVSVNVSCVNASDVVILFNGSVGGLVSGGCGVRGGVVALNGSASVEGLWNVSLLLNGSDGVGFNRSLGLFVFDLYAPTIQYYNLSVFNGFNVVYGSADLTCNDSGGYNVSYSGLLNNVSVVSGNFSSGYAVVNNTVVFRNGQNLFNVTCSDFFGGTNAFLNQTIFKNEIVLIDELDNTVFGLNISVAKVYFDDNSTSYDFKGTGTTRVNFTSLYTNKLRFEFSGYDDGAVVIRYVDASLSNGSMRVCANKETVDHTEQFFVSNTERVVVVKNVFSNCLITQDYTRFAYQDSLLLKAWSIDSNYYLYTYDGSEQVFLASLDGSISSTINMDILEFSQRGYNLGIQSEGLGFDFYANETLRIVYQNFKDDNSDLSVEIKRLDTDLVVFSSVPSDANSFTIYFYYGDLGVTNETVFKITLTGNNAQGDFSLIRYFNTAAKSGSIRKGLAIVGNFFFVVFGVTVGTVAVSLGWLGGLFVLMGAGLLSAAEPAWYVTFFLYVDIIIIVFLVLLSAFGRSKNTGQV